MRNWNAWNVLDLFISVASFGSEKFEWNAFVTEAKPVGVRIHDSKLLKLINHVQVCWRKLFYIYYLLLRVSKGFQEIYYVSI